MKNSILTEILKTFSKEEMKDFEKFIRSPYFGCRKFIISFFILLKKYYPDFNEEDISRQKLFSEMYAGKKYNDGLMRRMISELIKYSEEYLMIKRLYMTDVFRNNCMVMELRDRNLSRAFEKKSKKILNELKANKVIDFYTILDRHFTEIEIYNNMQQHNIKGRLSQLDKSLESLIIFFLNTYSSSSNTLINSGETIESDVTKAFMESFDREYFIKQMEKSGLKSANLIKAIHYANSIMVNKKDKKSFLKLKDILKNGYDIFSEQQRMVFYSKLFRFYSFYDEYNDDTYLEEQYADYKTVIYEKLYLIYYPYMSIFVSRNFINVCKMLSKTAEMEKFVRECGKYFDPEYKSELIDLFTAEIKFCKGEYENSLESCSRLKIEVPVFRKDIKLLRIKCFYELNYVETFYSEIDSFNHYYRNSDTLTKEIQLSMKNFSKHVSGLMKLRGNSAKDKIYILKKAIEKEKLIFEKKWLLEKIDGKGNI